MTASLPSDAAPTQTLELKGTTLPVTAIMIGQADAPNLQLALAGKLGEAPGFFEGELALLDLTRLPADMAESVQLDRLIALLRQAGMIPVAARGLSGSMAAVAEALGLAVLPAAPAAPAARERLQAAPGAPTAPASHPAASQPAAAYPSGPSQPAAAQPALTGPAASAQATAAVAAQPAPVQPAPTRPSAAAAPEASALPDDAPDTVTALVVERPLRSGQRIYARGRDLVLLYGVSPGAEVIADGSIHCYGKLRGRALAGASGDAAARIFAQDFQAELVSIAGVWRNFEPTDVRIRGGEPVRVSLIDDGTTQAIAIEPIAAD